MLFRKYTGFGSLESRIDLLNRPFDDGFLSSEIIVQYPVNFKTVYVPSHMGDGENKNIAIELENISTMPLCDSVTVHVILGNKIVTSDPKVRLENDDYESARSKVLVFNVPRIDALSVYPIFFNIKLHESCLLFSTYDVQIQLFLRNKKIEFCNRKIRKSPIYNPVINTQMNKPSAKVLFFTSQFLRRQDFVCFSYLLDMLKLPYDMWDIER